jgi:hypothetical protein
MDVALTLRSPSQIAERPNLRRSWLGSLPVKYQAASSCIQDKKIKRLRVPLKQLS